MTSNDRNKYYLKSGPYKESFRALATNIEFSDVDHAVQVIVMTSANPNEGKSTVSVNLAEALAQSGSSVLLIDCDLRNPTLAKLTGEFSNAGLTNILVNRLPIDRVVLLPEEYHFDLLLTGPLPPNPTEVLKSQAMMDFIHDIKGHYHYVIIDASPVGIVTDAAIISTYSDGVVIVSEYGKTKKEELKYVVNQLRHIGANLLGVVLNKVPMERGGGIYYGQ